MAKKTEQIGGTASSDDAAPENTLAEAIAPVEDQKIPRENPFEERWGSAEAFIAAFDALEAKVERIAKQLFGESA